MPGTLETANVDDITQAIDQSKPVTPATDAGGTMVTANPGGTGLLDLTTIGIDGTAFNIAGMGGGGSDGVVDSASLAISSNKLNIDLVLRRTGGLADVTASTAISGISYNQLSDLPTIPPGQLPSNWNATSGVQRILNKPPNLTQTQVEDPTDATFGLISGRRLEQFLDDYQLTQANVTTQTDTTFGLVSGQRLSQFLAGRLPDITNRLIPAGGMQFQLLGKESGNNYDVGWQTVTVPAPDGTVDSFAVSQVGGNKYRMSFLVGRTVGADIPAVYDLPQFDIHDDVSAIATSIDSGDRLVVSKEGDSGDPMEAINVEHVREYMVPALEVNGVQVNRKPLDMNFTGDIVSGSVPADDLFQANIAFDAYTTEQVDAAIAAATGLQAIATDLTIDGTGEAADPLKVASPTYRAGPARVDIRDNGTTIDIDLPTNPTIQVGDIVEFVYDFTVTGTNQSDVMFHVDLGTPAVVKVYFHGGVRNLRVDDMETNRWYGFRWDGTNWIVAYASWNVPLTISQVLLNISTWALAINPQLQIPEAKMPDGLHNGTPILAYSSNQQRLTLTIPGTGSTSVSGDVNLPSWATETDVDNRVDALVENFALVAHPNVRATLSKVPEGLVTDIPTFAYDVNSRNLQLGFTKNDGLTPAMLSVTLPASGIQAINTPGFNNSSRLLTIPYVNAEGSIQTVDVTIPGGGTGDNTLPVLAEAMNRDGTDDLPTVQAQVSSTQQDYLLIYDTSASALRLTGTGDLLALAQGDYVDSSALAVSGNDLTLTLGRTGLLPDLTATVTLPSGGMGGTSVVANPGGMMLPPLTSIGIAGTNYEIAGTGGAATPSPAYSSSLDDDNNRSGSLSWADITAGLGGTNQLLNVVPTAFDASSGTDLICLEAGNYYLTGTVNGRVDTTSSNSARGSLLVRLVRTRGGVETVVATSPPSYSRNQYTGLRQLGGTVHATLPVEVNDSFHLEILYQNQSPAVQFDVEGDKSSLSAYVIGGTAGPPGPPGTVITANPSTSSTTPIITSIGIGADAYRLLGQISVNGATRSALEFLAGDFIIDGTGVTSNIRIHGDYKKIELNPGGTNLPVLNTIRYDNQTYALPGGSGSDNYVDSISGTLDASNMLNLTLGRTGVLADLMASVDLSSLAGGGPDTNDYVNHMEAVFNNTTRNLTITLGRTGTLVDLERIVNIPAGGSGSDNYVDGVVFQRQQNDIALILERTGTLPDIVRELSLPDTAHYAFSNTGTMLALDVNASSGFTDRNTNINLATVIPFPETLSLVQTGSTLTATIGRPNFPDLTASATITAGAATSEVAAPITGDGSTSDPITLADLGVEYRHLSQAVQNSIFKRSVTGLEVKTGEFLSQLNADGTFDAMFLRTGLDTTISAPVVASLSGWDEIRVNQAYIYTIDGGPVNGNPLQVRHNDIVFDPVGGTWSTSTADDGMWVTKYTFPKGNPAANPTALLEAATIEGTTYQTRNLHAVQQVSDRPAASALTVGQGSYVIDSETLYIGVDIPHFSAETTGTFNNRPTRADLNIVSTLPTNLNNLTAGHYYYEYGRSVQQGGQEFYEIVSRFGTNRLEQVTATEALAGSRTSSLQTVVFLGYQATPEDALRFTPSVNSGNDYMYIDSDDNLLKLLDQDTFTAAGQTSHHYQWLPAMPDAGGTSSDNYVENAAFGVSGQDVTLTLGRTGTLADLTASFTAPGGAQDTKVVTALPNPEDVTSTDKDKVWLVVPTAGEGSESVAHFVPIAEHVMTFTAERFTESGDQVTGFNATQGHAVPDSTNIETLYWNPDQNDTNLRFTSDRTPFDFHDLPHLTLYLRESETTGQWFAIALEEQGANSGTYESRGASATTSIVAGVSYDMILRDHNAAVATQHVNSVPTADRLVMFPGAGRFRPFADIDALEHLNVVVETHKQVDGEVQSVDLTMTNGTLDLTIERSIGADLTDSITLTSSDIPDISGTYARLGGATFTGPVGINIGSSAGPALLITKGDTGNNPVVRMIHPNNQTEFGQRPFNARRSNQSVDYFEVNARMGGSNDNPGISLGTGSGGRDVALYRGGSNLLETPDTFRCDELEISGSVATTRTNLGLATVASTGSYNDLTDTPAVSGGFDLHDDVSTSATPTSSDRFVFSDEGTSGDPNRYTTYNTLSTEIRNDIVSFDLPNHSANLLTSGTVADARLPFHIVDISESDYDALGTPASNTLYVFTS